MSKEGLISWATKRLAYSSLPPLPENLPAGFGSVSEQIRASSEHHHVYERAYAVAAEAIMANPPQWTLELSQKADSRTAFIMAVWEQMQEHIFNSNDLYFYRGTNYSLDGNLATGWGYRIFTLATPDIALIFADRSKEIIRDIFYGESLIARIPLRKLIDTYKKVSGEGITISTEGYPVLDTMPKIQYVPHSNVVIMLKNQQLTYQDLGLELFRITSRTEIKQPLLALPENII